MFVRVRYELYEDEKPRIGSSGGGSIHASNEVEAHEACCAPNFFLLVDLKRRKDSGDKDQRNRWSHENTPIDSSFAAAVVGNVVAQKGSSLSTVDEARAELAARKGSSRS